MPGIWNINSVNDIEARKILRKLSFTVGENFLARVMSLDKLTGDVLLKLLDGWQFSAKLEKPLDNLKEGLLRFEVEGFEDGKLQIKVLNDNKKQEGLEKNTIDSQLKEKGINVSKEDYMLLNKMVKHEIPLTKENISNIKTLVDFKNKIMLDGEEENAFIMKYMEGKNISVDSKEGMKIRETLKGFFNELKNVSEDDIITLFENNIDLTEENIKSFNNVFKGSSVLYKDIKDNLTSIIDYDKNIKVDTKEVDFKPSEDKSAVLEDNSNKTKVLNDKDSQNGKEQINNKQEGVTNNIEKDKNNLLDKAMKKPHSIDEAAKNIKEQISVKTEEMKNIIKTVLEQKNENKPEAYNNLIQALDKNINDFKVYNSVSNQYYYLDLPINLENHEYECKLMIKDERKKGKKIDSTDVKIAASVNTIHMGIVDAYIKVNNSNMDINIKCDGYWMKLLDIGKEKILDDISNMGYNVYIRVEEREKEMNITNCREFFGDNNLGMINVKV